MFKLSLLAVLGLATVVTSPLTAPRNQQQSQVQCVPELTARKIAEETSLPEYPEEAEPGSSQGVVFAAVLFGTDGKLSKIRFYETPNAQASEAVEKALRKWKLKELFDGEQQPITTRTALRFHFVFEDGKGRVEIATEQEQLEFGGKWGTKACRSSLDQ
jgi:outer membrane biosynthesis protein TonB